MLGYYNNYRCINPNDNRLPNLKMTVCATFEVSNMKHWYGSGDLDNEIKSMACNENISMKKISSLHPK